MYDLKEHHLLSHISIYLLISNLFVFMYLGRRKIFDLVVHPQLSAMPASEKTEGVDLKLNPGLTES